MRLADALRGVNVLAFDTAPFIHYVESQPAYAPLVDEVFDRLDAGQVRGVTSAISFVEVLVKPILLGDVLLQSAYEDLLIDNPRLELWDIDRRIARKAAELRATYRLQVADSVQIAVAIHAACQAFLTNDRRLQRVSQVPVLVLDDLQL